MARILFIGAGAFQLPAIARAKQDGHFVIGCDRDADAAGQPLCDIFEAVDVFDREACLNVARRHRIDAVTVFATEAGVPTCAHIADQLKLPGLPVSASIAVTNKLVMRERFAGAGLPSPEFHGCDSPDQAIAAFDRIGQPCVVKPSNGAGSRGVSYVGKREQVAAAFLAAKALTRGAPVVVERFMPGREVAVEGFVQSGRFHLLCISDKVRTGPPFLLDTRIHFPSWRAQSEQDSITDVARDAVAALGIDNAPVHMELIMTDAGPHLVEVAARGAGFHVFAEIVPWVTGVDTLGLQLALALGEPFDIPAIALRGAVLDFPSVAAGRLETITGWDDVTAHDDTLFAMLLKGVGDSVPPLRSGADRVAAIAVRGETANLAQSTLDDHYDRLSFTTRIEPAYSAAHA